MGGRRDWKDPMSAAEEAVALVRAAYSMAATGPHADSVRRYRALAAGLERLPDLSEEQLLRLARREATLRGAGAHVTYHDVPCTTCHGEGVVRRAVSTSAKSVIGVRAESCPTCGGDGFSPPL